MPLRDLSSADAPQAGVWGLCSYRDTGAQAWRRSWVAVEEAWGAATQSCVQALGIWPAGSLQMGTLSCAHHKAGLIQVPSNRRHSRAPEIHVQVLIMDLMEPQLDSSSQSKVDPIPNSTLKRL